MTIRSVLTLELRPIDFCLQVRTLTLSSILITFLYVTRMIKFQSHKKSPDPEFDGKNRLCGTFLCCANYSINEISFVVVPYRALVSYEPVYTMIG